MSRHGSRPGFPEHGEITRRDISSSCAFVFAGNCRNQKTQRRKSERLWHWESPGMIAVRLSCAYRYGAKAMVALVVLRL